jgi:hypothetical protein
MDLSFFKEHCICFGQQFIDGSAKYYGVLAVGSVMVGSVQPLSRVKGGQSPKMWFFTGPQFNAQSVY